MGGKLINVKTRSTSRCFGLARMGRKVVSAAKIIVLLMSLTGANAVSAQDGQLNIQELMDRLTSSSTQLESVEEVTVIYDQFQKSAKDSEQAILIVIEQVAQLEASLLESISEAEASNNEQIRSLVGTYQAQLEQVRNQSDRLLEIRRRYRESAEYFAESRNAAAMAIQLNQYDSLLDMVQRDIETFAELIESVEMLELESMGIVVPGILDCPGPGCPLAS